MSPLALVGLGSNLGDRKAILDGALESLRIFPGVNLRAVSRYHETRPVGGPAGQGPFLNAAASLEPSLNPSQLLGVLQEVEFRFGRERIVRWGERTLDLDLLLYGDDVRSTPDLVVPHPRFSIRRFVLAPAAEIAPNAIDPLTGRTVAELLAHLDRRPSLLCIDLLDTSSLSPEPGPLPQVYRRVVERLGGMGLAREAVPTGRCLPRHPWQRHLRRVTELARRLTTGHLRDGGSPDRWWVTNFSLTQELMRGTGQVIQAALHNQGRYVGPADMGRYRALAERAVSRALVPTLLVLIAGHGQSRCHDLGYEWPVLVPTSDDPEEIATEVVAACQGTRP